MRNPYWNNDFLGFFKTLVTRIFTGGHLASDEIQLIVLILISLSCSIIGTLLVLRKMTMLANSLSHTILLGIVVTFLLFAGGQFYALSFAKLMIAALITGVITTCLTELLIKGARLQEDAAIGLVFTSLFALGIVLVSVFTKNAHISVEAVMGNVDALHFNDIKLALTIAGINVLIFTLFYKQFLITTFDPKLAKNLGLSVLFFNYLLMLKTSMTAIGAFRAVGVFLFLALLVGPVITARLWTNRMLTLVLGAFGIGTVASVLAVATSRHILSVHNLPLSTAALVVVYIVLLLIASLALKPVLLKVEKIRH
ncbi:MAG: hypothetical protein SP1CHLAM54_12350 [Chlamydiia bacterium]|nr:hypothetical protein [Chlamydiia bacterium]MCH9616133.1 hypothetical protein [Chlamydiia bacterium]MCH9629444.1 hypothetical protein [Chlamydiia bacterium]